MRVVVDAAAGLLRTAEQTWPFEVDCRDGTASVEIDGLRFELRPLRWREKRNLARFAGAGEEFLERQILRLCVDRSDASSAGGGSREALVTLARWINAPEAAALPLTDGLLAQVSLELAGVLGCAPGALDGWPAHEVESLWHSARPALPPQTGDGDGEPLAGLAVAAASARLRPAPSATPVAAAPLVEADRGFTQILILPDPAPAGSEPRKSGGGPDTDTDQARALKDDASAAATDGPAVAGRAVKRRASAPAINAATSGGVLEKTDSEATEPREREERGTRQAGPRKRATPGAAVPAGSVAPGTRDAIKRPTPGRRGEVPRGLFRVSLAPPNGVSGDGRGTGGGTASPTGSAIAVGGGAGQPWQGAAALHQPLEMLTTEEPIEELVGMPALAEGSVARGPWPARAERQPVAAGPEAWLDELTERLAEAAADLGIDLEA